MPASVFNESHFDYNESRDEYVAEIAELSHKVGTSRINHAITVCGRHFQLSGRDMSGGDVAGWRYSEIGGGGKVLIIND